MWGRIGRYPVRVAPDYHGYRLRGSDGALIEEGRRSLCPLRRSSNKILNFRRGCKSAKLLSLWDRNPRPTIYNGAPLRASQDQGVPGHSRRKREREREKRDAAAKAIHTYVCTSLSTNAHFQTMNILARPWKPTRARFFCVRPLSA